MVIGRLEPGQARNTTFKKAIEIGLDEALTALEESFHDLSDEQVWGYPLPGRHNIGTIVMHLQRNLDEYTCRTQAGRYCLEHEDRFDVWGSTPEELRDKMHDLPTVEQVLQRHRTLREAAMANLAAASEDDLLGPRVTDTFWWQEQKRTSADAYLRTIMHTMAHVRQIWLMRGAMGLTDQHGWPEQHWA
ncbi:MAG TPA: DUF664 domain-containing protein [Phycisphaerae bacterium]|nr:DUF664 domain-containing protein [Phycisphaerae bacterium]